LDEKELIGKELSRPIRMSGRNAPQMSRAAQPFIEDP
jgi:hypothetical protein